MAKTVIPKRGLNLPGKGDNGWEPTGKNYLFTIGIDKYDHWKPPLNCAVKDIEDFAKVLLDRYNFEPENIVTLKDAEATEQNIIIHLKKLNKLVAKEDNLIVYFSGHGHYDEDQKSGFWIPVNARQGGDFEHEYLDTSIIANRLKAIDSLHTYLIIDACFSGTMVRKPKGAPKSEKYKSRRIFTSGRAEVVNDGPVGGNSPFAKGMLLTLEKNDAPFLKASDFMSDVINYVENQARQIPDIGILFDAGDEGGELVFRLKDAFVKPDKDDSEDPQPRNPLPYPPAPGKDLLEFMKLQKNPSYKRYASFIETYSKSPFVEQAKQEMNQMASVALNKIRVLDAIDSVSKEDIIKACGRFFKNFPGSEHELQVRRIRNRHNFPNA